MCFRVYIYYPHLVAAYTAGTELVYTAYLLVGNRAGEVRGVGVDLMG